MEMRPNLPHQTVQSPVTRTHAWKRETGSGGDFGEGSWTQARTPRPAQASPPDLPSPPSAAPGAPVPSRRRRARELRGRDAAGGSDVFPRLDAALGCRAGEGLSGFSQGTFKLFL